MESSQSRKELVVTALTSVRDTARRTLPVGLFVFVVVSSMAVGSVSLAGTDVDLSTGKAVAQTSEDNYIYTSDGTSTVMKIDTETNEIEWEYSGSGFNAFAVDVDSEGDVYAGDANSEVWKIDGETGEEIWTHTQSEQDVDGLVVENGYLYIANRGGVVQKVDTDTAENEWTMDGLEGVYSITADKEGNSYFTGGPNGEVYKADSDGNIVWETEPLSDIGRAVQVDRNGDVYASGDGEEVVKIDGADGSTIWTDNGYSSAVEYMEYGGRGGLYVGDQSGEVHRVGASSGDKVWTNDGHSSTYIGGITMGRGGSLFSAGSGEDIHEHDIDNGNVISTVGVSSTFHAMASTYDALEPYPTVSGTVEDSDREPIESATIEAVDGSGETVATDTTDHLGDYSLSLQNGTYDISASKQNYSTVNKTVTVSGEDQTVDFQLSEFNQSITLDSRMYLEHGQEAPYDVVVSVDDDRRGVTDNATVTSGNTSVVTIDDTEHEVVATNDTSVNQRTYVQAEWTDDEGNTYTTRRNVTVANATVENIQILPDFTRFTASLSDETVMVIIIATGVGAAAALFATSFAGVSAVTMVMLLGWLAGYVNNGMAILAVLMAMFVGMNVAGNVDYTVRR